MVGEHSNKTLRMRLDALFGISRENRNYENLDNKNLKYQKFSILCI